MSAREEGLTIGTRNRTTGSRSIAGILAYAPAVLWAAFLLYLGSRTWDGLEYPDLLPMPDKVVHFTLYGVLGLLAVLGWRRAGRRPVLWVPLLLALAVGTADELQQRGVPTRSADVYDWVADATAIAAAFAVLGRRASPRAKAK